MKDQNLRTENNVPQLVSADLRTTGVNAQPSNRTEQTINNLNHQHLQTLQEALEEKDRIIDELQQKIGDLEGTVNDLDFLLKDKKELAKEKQAKLTKISGILTSNLRTRKRSNTPYMAFFRQLDENFHSQTECKESKCKDCELPVIFRVKSQEVIHKDCWTAGSCQNCPREEIKPKLKKGDRVILEGKFEQSKSKNRPSFTCYSYQVLEGDSK